MTDKVFINVLLEILGIVFLWLGLAISVLVHETGHMAGYRLAKGEGDWTIQVGFGRKFIKTKHFDIRIIPFSGVYHDTAPVYTKAQTLLCSAGGPALNLLLILILFALHSSSLSETSAFIDHYGPTWDIIRSYNIIMFVSAIIPVRYPVFFPVIGGMESDGMNILKALRNTSGPEEADRR